MSFSNAKHFLILPHLGLGDQLIINGLVHFLREQYNPEKVVLVAKRPHWKTLADMYNGYSGIEIITVNGDEEVFGDNNELFLSMIKSFQQKGYKVLPCGVFTGSDDYLKLDTCWANCFYKQFGFSPSIRFDFFRFPKNLTKSEFYSKNLIQKIGQDYIVFHDDPSRDLILDYKSIHTWLLQNGLQNLPIVYLGENRYKYALCDAFQNADCSSILPQGGSLFDYVDILRNARVACMIDSSIAILLDLIPSKRENQKRFSFIRYSAFPTKGVYQSEWEYVS